MNILKRLAALWAGVVLFVVTFPARLVGLLGLVLVLTLAGWKICGQSFGSFSADQPFLAADAGAGEDPIDGIINELTNKYLYWVAEDLADGPVSLWEDRIQSVDFIQTAAGLQPTKGTNGVAFSATDYLTNNFVMFAEGSGTTNVFMLIVEVETKASGYSVLLSSIAGDPQPDKLWWQWSAGQVAIYRPPAATITSAGASPLDTMFDLVLFGTSSYTNGVAFKLNGTVNGWTPQIRRMGADDNDTSPFVGNVREWLILTNCHTWGSAMPASILSNLHYYASTKYGY